MSNVIYYIIHVLKIHVQTSKRYYFKEIVAFKWKIEVLIVKLLKCSCVN